MNNKTNTDLKPLSWKYLDSLNFHENDIYKAVYPCGTIIRGVFRRSKRGGDISTINDVLVASRFWSADRMPVSIEFVETTEPQSNPPQMDEEECKLQWDRENICEGVSTCISSKIRLLANSKGYWETTRRRGNGIAHIIDYGHALEQTLIAAQLAAENSILKLEFDVSDFIQGRKIT